MTRMIAGDSHHQLGRVLLVFYMTTAFGIGAVQFELFASPRSEQSSSAPDQTREGSNPNWDQGPPPSSSVDEARISDQFRGHDRYYRVEYVYDGDSLRLKNGAELRMIGVDAPETSEKFSDQARAFVRKLLPENTIIGVDFDRRIRGRYDRLLGYIYVLKERDNGRDQTIMINERLIKYGLAHTFLHQSNTRRADQLISAQRKAIKQKRNLFENIERKNNRYYRVHGGFRYHLPDCKYVRDIPAEKIDVFHSRKKALLKGYNAASSCLEEKK